MKVNQTPKFTPESVVLRADVVAAARKQLSPEELSDLEVLLTGLFGERRALPLIVVRRLARAAAALEKGLSEAARVA